VGSTLRERHVGEHVQQISITAPPLFFWSFRVNLTFLSSHAVVVVSNLSVDSVPRAVNKGLSYMSLFILSLLNPSASVSSFAFQAMSLPQC